MALLSQVAVEVGGPAAAATSVVMKQMRGFYADRGPKWYEAFYARAAV